MKSIRMTFIPALLLIGLLAMPSVSATAQTNLPTGIATRTLKTHQQANAPSETWQLIELTLDPGVAVTMRQPFHATLVTVISGELTDSFAVTGATLTRTGGATSETALSGKAYTLQPGETVTNAAGTEGQILQNHGQLPLVLVASAISEDGQPGFTLEPVTPVPHGANCNCH